MTRHRSIAAQVLLPIAGIQAATVVCVAAASAYLAAARAERGILDRIAGASATVERATFPLTPPVVEQMTRLSGVGFVVLRDGGRATASTVAGPVPPPAGTPFGFAARSISDLPRVDVAGRSHFAVRLRARDGAEILALTPESALRRARREALVPPIVLGLGSLVLMTAATGLVAARIGRRIGAARAGVARVAEGDFVDLDPGPRRDEVHDLIISINYMCAQLRDMRGSIVRAERSRLLAQVAAGWTHGLRNAITGARMSVQLHARRCPAQEGDRSLEVALRQLATTEGSLRGLLALGRTGSRVNARVRLDETLAEVVRLVEPAAAHAGVRLDAAPAPGPVELLADEGELQSALLNILLNAVEATGGGGRVEVRLWSRPGEATIEVSDDGPGPPPTLADRLFEPFVTGKPEGVGLGLPLARRVAEEHGGGLDWFRDSDVTTFRMTLRAAPPSETESR